EKADRPKNAGEVAAAVHAFRAEAEERAKQAELDRARAEVRAEEEAKTRREAQARAEAQKQARRAAVAEALAERKRRRVQVALACAVLVLVAGGGAVAWWLDKVATARKAREEQVRRSVMDSLDLAAGLRKQSKFGEARGTLAQAEKLAEGGPPDLLQ